MVFMDHAVRAKRQGSRIHETGKFPHCCSGKRYCNYRIYFCEIGRTSQELPLCIHTPIDKKKSPSPVGLEDFLRKGWDSNPRSVISRTHDFQSCALDQLSHLCVLCPSIESIFLSDSFNIIPQPIPFVNPFSEKSKKYFSGNDAGQLYRKKTASQAKVHKKYILFLRKCGIITIQKPQEKAHILPAGTEFQQRW